MCQNDDGVFARFELVWLTCGLAGSWLYDLFGYQALGSALVRNEAILLEVPQKFHYDEQCGYNLVPLHIFP